MSVRVLPLFLGLLLVTVGTPGASSSEPIPEGFSIPLSAPATSLTVDQPPADRPVVERPVVENRPGPTYPALAESVNRETRPKSSLRWVQAEKPREASRTDAAIQPIPHVDADAFPDLDDVFLNVDVLPDAEPWDSPSPTPAPPLPSDVPLVQGTVSVDLHDAVPTARTTGTGIVQAAPTLVVEIAGPPRTSVGATASFVIYVKNMGAVTADGVVVQTMIPKYVDVVGSQPEATLTRDHMLTFEMGDLDSEAIRTIHLNLMPRSTGEVRLHTSVGFSVAASSTVQVGRPILSLKCEAPTVAALGDLVTFRLVVENAGDAMSEGVTVVPQVAADGESEMSPVGRFEVGTLAPGSSKEILLRAMANREGSMQIQFVATDDSGQETTTQTHVLVRSTALDVTLVVPDETRLGVEQDYEIRVSNSDQAPAGNVRVACSLPTGFRLTVIESSVQFSPDFSAMTWQVGEMVGGTTKVLRFKARVGAQGTHTLRAVLESDRLANPQTIEATIGVHDDEQYQRTASRN